MFTIIWFLIWWNHGFPNIIDNWNPWLIWLLVCLFILDGASFGAGRRYYN